MLLAMTLLGGCTLLPYSMPTQEDVDRWLEQMPLGGTKRDTDQHFASRDNQTGRWESSLLNTELTEHGKRATYRYHWVTASSFYLSSDVYRYDLIFLEDRLIRFERAGVTSSGGLQVESAPSTGKVNYLCKDAVARGDEGAIRTYC